MSIKRNLESFPKDFMFGLAAEEWKEISSSQIVMKENLPKNHSGKVFAFMHLQNMV